MPFSTAAEPHELEPGTAEFYCRALRVLTESDVPYLVGGAFALHRFTGVERYTKDLDVFVKPEDIDRALAILASTGCRTEVTATHWLGKAFCGETFIDVIFNSGNGVAAVDDEWFEHAIEGNVLGMVVPMCPPEEMIWSKSFVMERERFDGADVAHMLHACAHVLDWDRLLRRFDDNWRVLYAHLVLFAFVYPSERERIPAWVTRELMDRAAQELVSPPPEVKVCRGTLLSRQQYLVDVERRGYLDARVWPEGDMSAKQASDWSHEITGEDRGSEREGEAAVGGGR